MDVVGQTIGEAIVGGIERTAQQRRGQGDHGDFDGVEEQGSAAPAPRQSDLVVEDGAIRAPVVETGPPANDNGSSPQIRPRLPPRPRARTPWALALQLALEPWINTWELFQPHITPLTFEGNDTGLRIREPVDGAPRLQQNVDGEWRTLDVFVQHNDATPGDFIIDGVQLANAYVGEADPDLTDYYRAQFDELYSRPFGQVEIYGGLTVPDSFIANWDFRALARAINQREQPGNWIVLGRLFDTEGIANVPGRSGPNGRSWTLGSGLMLSLRTGMDVDQWYGLPDGRAPPLGNPPLRNDGGMTSFGIIWAADYANNAYIDHAWNRAPPSRTSEVPFRGGTEVARRCISETALLLRS